MGHVVLTVVLREGESPEFGQYNEEYLSKYQTYYITENEVFTRFADVAGQSPPPHVLVAQVPKAE